MSSPQLPHPRVGVAAIIRDTNGQAVVGVRKGSHGTGTWQFPGGHLEHGESFASCAAREVLEETGLEIDIKDTKVFATTNDVFKKEGKHYITVFVVCKIKGDNAEPMVMEPEKCEKWEWVHWPEIWKWAQTQAEAERNGKRVEDLERKVFLPIVNLVRQYPELENSLD
ncbi:nudix domain-containing protein [Delitschia confertaspora ATCC 74209]|uniref:Nudix domain-containing protein n=1 Tax=Delitschia confertaspora ATCC 74209 TaxID=1513339 RepID=A0A9P4JQX4_9PLEO|nr:nudix domain-containing protein [Delitschia confertaspora ATCC 74209]